MHRSKPLTIAIKNPCNQPWDEMEAMSGGRFCSECQKTVTDFTNWSDGELYKFLAKPRGNICGRFLTTQVNRPITIPYQPYSRLYRITVAIGLTIICAQTPTILAQNRPPKVQQSIITGDTIIASKPSDTGWIHGSVCDTVNNPLFSAVIKVYQNGEFIGETKTDYEGNYVIDPLLPGKYDLSITYAGNDTVRHEGVIVHPGKGTFQAVKCPTLARRDIGSFISGQFDFRPVSLYGYIRNDHKCSVNGAEVYIYKNNVLIARTVTNKRGRYKVTNLNPDTYHLHVIMAGYEQVTINNIDLNWGKKQKDAKIYPIKAAPSK